MAQTLREGCSYSLITQEENHEKRQVYFVKLTDSCLKAIEEYTNDFKGGSQVIIKFDGQNGSVAIPSRCASTQDVEKKFHFAISNVVSTDTSPLQECIRHGQWNSNTLQSYGPLEQKISIAATDDVYENTRNRMAQVDQERKDIRTKEIKLGSMKKGKSVAKVIPPDNHKNIMKKKLSSHMSHSPKSSIISSTNNIKSSALPSNHKPSILSTNNKISVTSSSTNLKPSVTSSTNNVPSPSKRSPSARKSPTSTSHRNSPSTGTKSFTCRERVMHILALRPHKKPELISRLQREAMSQKDRSNLAMVLQQVSSHGDNQFTLLPHLYADLQVNTWPFYSESEKLIVKRNTALNKKVGTTSPQLVSSTSKSPEEKVVSKRPLPASDVHTSKKTKVESSDEPSSTSVSPKTYTNNEKKIYTTSPHRSKEENHSNGELKKKKAPSPVKREEKVCGEESPPTVASTSDSPEYLLHYKPITSREQRFQYKRDFQSEYPEYIKLKNSVDAVAMKFIELDRSWRRTKEGSAEYLRLQEEIMTAYNKQQEDETYHGMKRRCEELHQKLSHIKKLVVEYDNQMVTS